MSRERLTDETLDNAISTYKTTVEFAEDIDDEDYSTALDKVTLSFLEELKQYRDLEEQGLLFRFPCKVGDTVYRLVPKTYRKISQIKIVRFVVDENGFGFIGHSGLYHSCKEIGKTVFLTQLEAEEKLRELEGK